MNRNSPNRRKFFALLGTGSLAIAAQSISNIVLGQNRSVDNKLPQTQAKPENQY